jgi:hypothetical protein
MRSNRIVCAILATLNVIAAAAGLVPRGGGDPSARAPLPARAEKAARPRGEAVIFRPRGERPAPAPPGAGATPKRPIPAPPVEAPIDRDSFAYLGAMTAVDGTSSSFFMNRATSRVYASGGGEGEPSILEASDKEILIELDGTKYLVAR